MKYGKMKQGSNSRQGMGGSIKQIYKCQKSKKPIGDTGMHQPTSKVR